jgi:hypothetical protein
MKMIAVLLKGFWMARRVDAIGLEEVCENLEGKVVREIEEGRGEMGAVVEILEVFWRSWEGESKTHEVILEWILEEMSEGKMTVGQIWTFLYSSAWKYRGLYGCLTQHSWTKKKFRTVLERKLEEKTIHEANVQLLKAAINVDPEFDYENWSDFKQRILKNLSFHLNPVEMYKLEWALSVLD